MTQIEDQTQIHTPLNTMMIMARAKILLAMFKEKARPDYKFTASFEWFKQMENCYLLHNMKMNSEFMSADMKDAGTFLSTRPFIFLQASLCLFIW